MQLLRTIFILSVLLLITFSISMAGGSGGQTIGLNGLEGLSIFAGCAIIAIGFQWFAFIPAFLKQTERFYDLTGGITYLAVIGFALWQADKTDLRSIVLSCLVAIWAIRLASFLFIRISQDGSDSRFDEIKPNFGRFLNAWSVQGLWVLITAGAALAAIASNQRVEMSWLGALGIVIWLVGFVIEVVADKQKRVFRKTQPGSDQPGFIHTGLWAYSRHPNYLGEIILWTGVALVAYPALQNWQLVTLISPFFVTLLLVKVSGIPLLEKKADKRWQGDDKYQQYKQNTPVLIPKLSGFFR